MHVACDRQIYIDSVAMTSGNPVARESMVTNYINNSDELWTRQMQIFEERDSLLTKRLQGVRGQLTSAQVKLHDNTGTTKV